MPEAQTEQLSIIANLLHRIAEGPASVGILEVANHMRNCLGIAEIVPKPNTSIEKLEDMGERMKWLRAAQAFLSTHRVSAK